MHFKENDEKRYRSYDAFVAETFQTILNRTANRDRIILAYNCEDLVHNYAFVITDMVSMYSAKKVYISTTLWQYIKLKVKYGRKRKFKYYRTKSPTIIPNEIVCNILQNREHDLFFLRELYEEYYEGTYKK